MRIAQCQFYDAALGDHAVAAHRCAKCWKSWRQGIEVVQRARSCFFVARFAFMVAFGTEVTSSHTPLCTPRRLLSILLVPLRVVTLSHLLPAARILCVCLYVFHAITANARCRISHDSNRIFFAASVASEQHLTTRPPRAPLLRGSPEGTGAAPPAQRPERQRLPGAEGPPEGSIL